MVILNYLFCLFLLRRPPFKWSETDVGPVPEFRTIDEFDFHPVTFQKSMGMIEIPKVEEKKRSDISIESASRDQQAKIMERSLTRSENE